MHTWFTRNVKAMITSLLDLAGRRPAGKRSILGGGTMVSQQYSSHIKCMITNRT